MTEHVVMFGQVLLAFLLGAFIGWERERTGVEAGIRTFGSIALGACVFGLISVNVSWPADTSRIASQVAIGVGFLGAGIIFRQGDYIKGLTTAATLWCAAAIGLAIAYKMLAMSFVSTLIIVFALELPRLRVWQKISSKQRRIARQKKRQAAKRSS